MQCCTTDWIYSSFKGDLLGLPGVLVCLGPSQFSTIVSVARSVWKSVPAELGKLVLPRTDFQTGTSGNRNSTCSVGKAQKRVQPTSRQWERRPGSFMEVQEREEKSRHFIETRTSLLHWRELISSKYALRWNVELCCNVKWFMNAKTHMTLHLKKFNNFLFRLYRKVL